MTITLPWFPPAPAAGPAGILTLPPDDWALEPKIDGIRVIWLDGQPFTRQAPCLALARAQVACVSSWRTFRTRWTGNPASQ